MIEYIKGELSELTPTYAVIDCGGVGYLLNISVPPVKISSAYPV